MSADPKLSSNVSPDSDPHPEIAPDLQLVPKLEPDNSSDRVAANLLNHIKSSAETIPVVPKLSSNELSDSDPNPEITLDVSCVPKPERDNASDQVTATLVEMRSDPKPKFDTLIAPNISEGKAPNEVTIGNGVDVNGAFENNRMEVEALETPPRPHLSSKGCKSSTGTTPPNINGGEAPNKVTMDHVNEEFEDDWSEAEESESAPSLSLTSEDDESSTTPENRDAVLALEANEYVRAPVLASEIYASLSGSVQRRRRKRGAWLEQAMVSSAPETPYWLPPGWRIEDRVRTAGATAGMIDKYYYDPEGRQYRSRKEVLLFLESRIRRCTVPLESSVSLPCQQNGSNDSQRKQKPKSDSSKFDFVDKVTWVFTCGETSAIPFVGGEKVPESIRREWAATFASLVRESGVTPPSQGDGTFTESPKDGQNEEEA